MRNRTPTKGITRGDTVQATPEAVDTLGVNWARGVVTRVRKHIIDGKPERTLVQVVYYHPITGLPALDALHETWLEKVAV